MKSLPRFHVLAACLLFLTGFAALPGCATFGKGGNQLIEQVAIQYATGKFIEAEKGAEARAARAHDVAKVANELKEFASRDGAAIPELRELALAKIADSKLEPSDALLASALVEAAVTALADKVEAGVLSPDTRIAVNKLLDWVILAAAAYG